MRKYSVAVMIAPALISITSGAQRLSRPHLRSALAATPVAIVGSNLPFAPIGVSDLVQLTVSNSPELSQSFRVDSQGKLNLPLLRGPILAKGLMPTALRDEIAAALRAQHLLVNPIVVVSVVEYRSRSVTVDGAVKRPTTIQDLGNLRVLGALTVAGGLLPEAGPEIIVERADGHTIRLTVRHLYDGLHEELNIPLEVGMQIRVPQCEQVFVVGEVRRPGSFPFQDVEDTTVLKLLALSGGLSPYSRNTAYIFRIEPGNPVKREIEVPLKRILDRKSPDVSLVAGDILYIPTNSKM